MHVHIALFRWKAGTPNSRIDEALRTIESLKDKVDGIVEISCRRNTSKYAEGYTHVVLVRGRTAAALEAYRKHPDHERAARDIDAMEDHGIGVDFETADV